MKLGLICALVMAIATLSLSCGDGSDTLTLEEYFAELEAIQTDGDLSAQFEEAFAVFEQDVSEEEFNADEANVSLVQDSVAALAGIFGDLADLLKALDPPSEVETEHDDLVDAYEDLVVALQEDSEAVGAAETMAELIALEAPIRTLFGPPGARIDEACFELVLVADANGITVSDATCGYDD